MKITVSKHTTIDWAKIREEVEESVQGAVDNLMEEAITAAAKLMDGKSITVTKSVGKITIRRAKE